MRRSSAARRRARLAVLLLAGIVAALALAAVARAATAAASDPLDAGWESGWGLPGLDGPVFALTGWQNVLAVGGDFTTAGPIHSAHVALFWRSVDGDSTRWIPLGDGLPGEVRSLAVFQGQLVAGCAAGSPGGSVFVWDGQSWTALGPGFLGDVSALAVYGGELYAGGTFSQEVGGRAIDGLVRWDGSAWQVVGSGVNGWVKALQVYGSALVAGGRFGGSGAPGEAIASWDGAHWSPLGGGFRDRSGGLTAVTALTLYVGGLVAGGTFDTAADDTTLVLDNLARWDGAHWSGVGVGTSGPVYALASYIGSLWVGGAFDSVGGLPLAHLARWDNQSTWRAVGAPRGTVRALATWENGGARIGVGGEFHASFGGNPLEGAGWWDGAGVSGLEDPGPYVGGLDFTARDLLVSGDSLLVAGDFGHAASGAGWRAASGVASWGAGGWGPLGAGLRHGSSPGSVRTIAMLEGQLYAGGQFDSSGAQPVAWMARWNGAAWSGLGAGLNGLVTDLVAYRGGLVAVGAFANIGGTGTNGIGLYSGGAWHSLLNGFDADAQPEVACAFGSLLVVGGSFAGANLTTSMPNIAQWNGVSWYPLGDGLNGTVHALLALGGSLIAAGRFTASGARPLAGVASWDGNAWRALGDQFTEATALGTYRADLVASGTMLDPQGQSYRGVARWDGAHWWPMGSGIPDGVVAKLVEWSGRLWAVGSFDVMGDKPSAGIATWRDQNVPGGWPYSHPPLALAAPAPSPAIGSATLSFQLPGPGPVEVAIFDVRGRRVATVASGAFIGGPQRLTWDGRDDDGRTAPAGVYFARLSAAGSTRVARIVLLR